mmetsp:Transcript_71733/g.226628  ORF Transcript_71733/g.226628 Transcript_71733/m.226628 type:complete len:201 (+) Transcript_71733:1403-2005(+)
MVELRNEVFHPRILDTPRDDDVAPLPPRAVPVALVHARLREDLDEGVHLVGHHGEGEAKHQDHQHLALVRMRIQVPVPHRGYGDGHQVKRLIERVDLVARIRANVIPHILEGVKEACGAEHHASDCEDEHEDLPLHLAVAVHHEPVHAEDAQNAQDPHEAQEAKVLVDGVADLQEGRDDGEQIHDGRPPQHVAVADLGHV